MKELLKIYIEFFKMGAITFGGGYAMLPILRRGCVDKHQWITEEELMDYYAVGQALPGLIAVNVSVFIGYKLKKLKGGIAASLGCVSPCIIIITLIAAVLSNFQDNVYVRHAMAGITTCVVALILDAVLSLAKKGIKDIFGIVLCAVSFSLISFTSISPVIVVVVAAILGITLKGGKKKQ